MTQQPLQLNEIKELIKLKKENPEEYKQYLKDIEGVSIDLVRAMKGVMIESFKLTKDLETEAEKFY